MTNTALFNKMVNSYNALSYAHNYIYGFYYENNVYMVYADSSINAHVLKLEKAGSGNGYMLRFRPNKAQKLLLMGYNPILLCSKKFFNETVANSKYNKGEIFEKMVTEYHGQKWKKDNIPFTVDGDLTINNIAYQIKFDKGTFINEKQLAELSR